ncbi:hypothetical protein A2U01_0092221, partial [Trifolium medium]|nr:hypothetical protein [Trifolium medium]
MFFFQSWRACVLGFQEQEKRAKLEIAVKHHFP